MSPTKELHVSLDHAQHKHVLNLPLDPLCRAWSFNSPGEDYREVVVAGPQEPLIFQRSHCVVDHHSNES